MLIDSINIMRTGTHEVQLHGCGWVTVSLGAEDMAVTRERVERVHAGRSLIASCQRLEAFGASPCDCDAPEKWHGREALGRIAAVAAGLDSAVLGEEQILGQVRTAFAGAPASMQKPAEVAIAAARELRRRTRFDIHAGHLLDRGLNLSGTEPSGSLLVL